VVYSSADFFKGEWMLSTSEVTKLLGITKVTLANWTKNKPTKIKARRYKFGSKFYWGYSPAEVKRVKFLMKKKCRPGVGWF